MQQEDILFQICQLPKADSLQQLCDLTYHITGHPVFVSDMAHTILAYTRCVDIPDPVWQSTIVGAELDKNTLVQDREVGIVHKNSIVIQKPVLVEDDNVPYPRFIRTLVDQGNPIGIMVVTSYIQPFSEGDAELIELISSFMIPMLKKERYFVSSNSKTVENFFIQLLEGKKMRPGQAEKRLRVLDYNRRPYMYLLTVCLRSQSTTSGSIEQLTERFLQLNHCHAFLFNSTLICIYGSDQDITHWATQAPALHRLMQEEGLIAGVSRQIIGFEQLQDYYRQANAALTVGMKLEREQTTYFQYDKLSSFLLFERLSQEDLLRFCHQKIQLLGEYDAAHDTALCMTLQVYLEQAKSLVKTAEILHIHRNTVHYRINRCMELMNTTLEDGGEIFSYILSLQILEYLKRSPRSIPDTYMR